LPAFLVAATLLGGAAFSGCGPAFERVQPAESRRWRLAICAIKLAEQIPLDFFFQVFYPTSGGF
jgi:hypothetical protein